MFPVFVDKLSKVFPKKDQTKYMYTVQTQFGQVSQNLTELVYHKTMGQAYNIFLICTDVPSADCHH